MSGAEGIPPDQQADAARQKERRRALDAGRAKALRPLLGVGEDAEAAEELMRKLVCSDDAPASAEARTQALFDQALARLAIPKDEEGAPSDSPKTGGEA